MVPEVPEVRLCCGSLQVGGHVTRGGGTHIQTCVQLHHQLFDCSNNALVAIAAAPATCLR